MAAAEPHLRRLTSDQYEIAVADLLGENLVMPQSLEPDTPFEGKLAIGAGTTVVSAWGTERYEDAAYLLAEQALADAGWVSTNVPCGLQNTDLACAETFLADFGRMAWRRPLTQAELDRLVDVVSVVSSDLDFTLGLTYGIGAVLQSPYFLYRVEMGQADPSRPGQRLLTDLEAASRLSFLLWNSPPDRQLLDAAEAGELSTDKGLRSHAERMMADDRFRRGTRALFTDIFELYHLEDVVKDPATFTHASPDLADSAREETLALIEWLIIDKDADFRDLMTTQTTFVDQRLAALYDIPAPTPDGHGKTQLPNDGRRRGLLGHASVLNLHSHATSTSSTLRGIFVRETLLCQIIPAPPADLNTAIPEPDVNSPTLRERMASHQEDPGCATCHAVVDPIGLGLENFDGIGRWRTHENGAKIDPSGDIDEAKFEDAWQLVQRVRSHENFVPCFTEHLHELATGHAAESSDEELLAWYADSFAESGYSWQALVLAVVTSPTFRQVGEVTP